MKVLLLSFGLTDHLLLASAYLKAYAISDPLLSEKADISMENLRLDDKICEILWQIKQQQPDIVGFSCYVWNVSRILSVCNALKQVLPEVTIVLGGPEVSPRAEEVMAENPSLDIVVRGEGEATFKELLHHHLTGNPPLRDISGIVYRDKGRMIPNKERPEIEDINCIPSPYLSGVISPDDERHHYLETQRGCIFRCRYCYYHEGYQGVRYFSLERVKEELLLLLKSEAKIVTFVDPTFNANKERMREICEFISENNKGKIAFHAEVRAELVDEEIADLLSRANFVYLEVGLQSTNREVLRLIDRKTDLAKFKRGVSLLLDRKIKEVELQLIIGLPGDDLAGFSQSLRFVLSVSPALQSVFRLMLLPGTYLFQNRDKFKIRFSKRPPHYVFANETFSFDEMMEAEMMANSLHVFTRFYNKTTSLLARELETDIFALYERWRTWMKDDLHLLGRSYIFDQGAKERFPAFIEDICEKNDIDYAFYAALLEKEKKDTVNRFAKHLESIESRTLAPK